MGNTPSQHHGSPGRPGSDLGRSGSQRRHANLRLPMPARSSVSPQTSSNPTSPSASSERKRKSLELPDLNKLSFTPAAPQPTTATSTTAAAGAGAGASSGSGSASGSVPSTHTPAQTSPGRKWNAALGARASPLANHPGLAPPRTSVDGKPVPISASAPAASAPIAMPGVTVVPVNDNTTYFPSQPIPIRSPRAANLDLPVPQRPHAPSANRRPDVRPMDTPLRSDMATPVPPPATPATEADDGLVDVPIQWTGGGKNVYVTGNFAENWRGRIKLKKSTHDFNTVLRLAPGQYRLKFIVDDSWRCSKAIPTATDNDGTLVNWIEVEIPKTEQELQAEWAMDQPAHKDQDADDDSQWTSEIPAPLVMYQYLEELPQLYPPDVLKNYVASTPYFSPVPKPPQLPRILEKVILNPETRRPETMMDPNQPAGVDDNSILPTPGHAVLGHLMASAIKNGTLGVGTTSRYRGKYITTMFFRPSHGDLAESAQQSQDPAHAGRAENAQPAPAAESASAAA